MEDNDDHKAAVAVQPPASEQEAITGPPSSSGEKARPQIVGLPWEMKQAIFRSLSSPEDAVSLASTCKIMGAMLKEERHAIASAILSNALGQPGLVRLALAAYKSRILFPYTCSEPELVYHGICQKYRQLRIENMENWNQTLRLDRIPISDYHRNAMEAVVSLLACHSEV